MKLGNSLSAGHCAKGLYIFSHLELSTHSFVRKGSGERRDDGFPGVSWVAKVSLSTSLHKRRPALGSLIELSYIKTGLSISPAVKMFHLSQVDTKNAKLLYYSDIVTRTHLAVKGKD